nr:hypothetical protein SEVIR_3G025066v2 [Setaria viridis]
MVQEKMKQIMRHIKQRIHCGGAVTVQFQKAGLGTPIYSNCLDNCYIGGQTITRRQQTPRFASYCGGSFNKNKVNCTYPFSSIVCNTILKLY